MSKLYENNEIRKEAERIVDRHIYHRANELADFALQNQWNADMNGIDQFAQSMFAQNYDDAALDWFKDLSDEEKQKICENEEITKEELLEQVLEYPESICNDHDVEPYNVEIFEFWAVSDYLARRLEEQGHATGELFDFTIWGRPTTGQGISLDYVILKIAQEHVNSRKG